MSYSKTARGLYGVKFGYTDAATITMTPSGIDGNAYIPMTSGTDLKEIVISSVKTMALTTSGAGGLDAGSEAASTGYDIRAIYNPTTNVSALLATVAGGSVTLPSGYTYYSDIIWFVANIDGGSNNDILPFWHISAQSGLICFYQAIDSQAILLQGKSLTGAVIDLSIFCPANCVATVNAYMQNTTANDAGLLLYAGASKTLIQSFHYWVDDDAGQLGVQSAEITIPVRTPSSSLYYAWLATPSFGLSLYPKGWIL